MTQNENTNSGAPEQDMASENVAAAGLPGAPKAVEEELRRVGIDPDRLSIFQLGHPIELLQYPTPPWVKRMGLGFALWLMLYGLQIAGFVLADWLAAGLSLLVGLIILQGACEALVTASVRSADKAPATPASRSERAASTTFAPSPENRRAVAAPIPEDAPVTITVFPANRCIVSSFLP